LIDRNIAKATQQLTADLSATPSDAFWAGALYLLAATVIQPVTTSFAGIFGARCILFISISVFVLGTWISAPLAQGVAAMLAGRAIQGLGTGGILALTMVTLGGPVTLSTRPAVFLTMIAVWCVGNLLSPVLGGLYVERLSWRWCFYVNVCTTLPSSSWILAENLSFYSAVSGF
jgi:MFS family permease